MFSILKYNTSIINYAIYIKLFSGVTVSYLTVFTDDVINTMNNETALNKITRGSQHGIRVRPYILVSVYGWVLGLNLRFRNPEKLSAEGKYMLGPHALSDSHTTG